MTVSLDECAICHNAHGADVQMFDIGGDNFLFECSTCGRFGTPRETYDDYLAPQAGNGQKLTPVARARLSHRVRNAADSAAYESPIFVTSEMVERFIEDGAPGPTPAEQARNAIRFIGDAVSANGEPVDLPEHFFAVVGSPTPAFAINIVSDLAQQGLITGSDISEEQFVWANLTLAGWRRYEEEKRGRTAGSYGFIALEFGDDVLDRFLEVTVKPAVAQIGYTLIDMRDVKQAGVIDNLMRERIRDAAFVLADLTHANNGAYWEAGFAEGLGKPVIYLCEQGRFDVAKTHFDTNHCTTVVWDVAAPEAFQKDLIATLRNSLNLFATG